MKPSTIAIAYTLIFPRLRNAGCGPLLLKNSSPEDSRIEFTYDIAQACFFEDCDRAQESAAAVYTCMLSVRPKVVPYHAHRAREYDRHEDCPHGKVAYMVDAGPNIGGAIIFLRPLPEGGAA